MDGPGPTGVMCVCGAFRGDNRAVAAHCPGAPGVEGTPAEPGLRVAAGRGDRARSGRTDHHHWDGTHVPTDRKDLSWRVDS